MMRIAAFLVCFLVLGDALIVPRRLPFGLAEQRPRVAATGPCSCRSTTTSTCNTPLTTSTYPQVGKLMSQPFKGLREEFKTRAAWYKDDWTVVFEKGSKKKALSTILFMYFACLAPTVAFGGLTNIITNGSIGVKEFLVSCGLSGMLYSIFSGQPMTFQGPTGLTLAFTSSLFCFTQQHGLPFMGIYCWTGIWTSLFLALASVFNLCELIKYCSRFTDDIFNALISINFLTEAITRIVTGFAVSVGGNFTTALSSLNIALATWLLTTWLASLEKSKLFSKSVRSTLSSFGPCLTIVAMSIGSLHPAIRSLGLERLKISTAGWAVPRASLTGIPLAVAATPVSLRLLAVAPAMLMTLLFYLDQNISVRAVEAFDLKKGAAYNLDLLAVSAITLLLSALGLPWTCAATVQSVAHTRSLGTVVLDEEGKEKVMDIIETRVTGFVTHALILLSVVGAPVLSVIPIPVISGLFLYLGVRMMKSNLFFERVADLVKEKRLLASSSIFSELKAATISRFIGVQAVLLAFIWGLKRDKRVALLFPSSIALLMVVRLKVMPLFFSPSELEILDPAS